VQRGILSEHGLEISSESRWVPVLAASSPIRRKKWQAAAAETSGTKVVKAQVMPRMRQGRMGVKVAHNPDDAGYRLRRPSSA
jgi:succinyl-CoA synthetase beta subunit